MRTLCKAVPFRVLSALDVSKEQKVRGQLALLSGRLSFGRTQSLGGYRYEYDPWLTTNNRICTI
jgi:hypothetical protein